MGTVELSKKDRIRERTDDSVTKLRYYCMVYSCTINSSYTFISVSGSIAFPCSVSSRATELWPSNWLEETTPLVLGIC